MISSPTAPNFSSFSPIKNIAGRSVWGSAFSKTYTYEEDELKSIQTGSVSTSYSYNADKLVSLLANTLKDMTKSFGYEYDKDGNITAETVSTGDISDRTVYTYDSKKQLTSAENSTTKWEYSYDSRGNILNKKEYAVTIDTDGQKVYTEKEDNTYAYDATWKDELTSYNGQSISYDASGNPISYLGHNLTWTMGRQLASFDDITYTYNEEGIRTSKTSNGVTTKYYLNGTNIIEQTDGTNTLHFYYDSSNELIGFNYADNDYFYVKNQQGDITDIVDVDGNVVASYVYDPWGKVLSVTGSNTAIGNINPFRYRSYYYDADIQMYYLQSRYYDADIGRFINCDDVSYIGASGTEAGYNAFAYCENEPVNCHDLYGFWGADIHYGRKYTNKKYVNKNNKHILYDGTYEWAKAMGFKAEYAHILADACRLVDKSPIYGPVIPTSNGFGHHFNFSYSKHTEDTRIMFANKWLLKAIDIFNSNPTKKKKREEAFKILGRGLHALQDYSAHGDFQPIETIYLKNTTMSGITTIFLIQKHSAEYDNPFFDWKNNVKRNSFGSKLSNVGSRYRETKIQTIIYLTCFLTSIKEKNLKYIYNQ